MTLREDLERLDTRGVEIMGEAYERTHGDRWRRLDGRIVLILDLADADKGELPWRVEVDGELLRRPLVGTPWRFSHPWYAVNAAYRTIAERIVQ